MFQPSNRGTVKPFPSFNAQVDAEALRKAIGGFGRFKRYVSFERFINGFGEISNDNIGFVCFAEK